MALLRLLRHVEDEESVKRPERSYREIDEEEPPPEIRQERQRFDSIARRGFYTTDALPRKVASRRSIRVDALVLQTILLSLPCLIPLAGCAASFFSTFT